MRPRLRTRFATCSLVAALVAAGCSSHSDGFAVDVTIVAGASLTDAQVASIHKLQVSSSDGFIGSVYDLGRAFSSSRKERLLYKPRAGTTSVTLTIAASTEAGDLVTSGSAEVALTAGKTSPLTVTLGQSSVAMGDLGAPGDGAAPGDMASTSTDMALGPVVPSHVSIGTMIPNAADLTGVTAIDTTAKTLTINGTAGAAPAGTQFVTDSGYAVLSVGKFTVSADIVVTGSVPLVVVASKEIVLNSRILAAGVGATPGPGGSAAAKGTGFGGNGNVGSDNHPAGGGGAGFGTAGAAGGANPDGSVSGGTAGISFNPTMTTFNGGSGGGSTSAGSGSFTPAVGGGGGGGVQLTSAISITVGAGGGINVGGGGGQGAPAAVWAAGGGGGSGGEIFLEAPAITVDGTLAANGGGGGSSNLQFGAGQPGLIGVAGQDGQFGTTPATGGSSTMYGGVFGGAGAAGSTAPKPGGQGVTGGTDTMEGGSGGGAAVGRIWLRTRNTAAVTTNGTLSPAPQLNGAL